MAYDHVQLFTVSLTVAAMQTANTDDLLIQLPTGKAGKFLGSSVFLTTGVTTAPAVFTLGTEADDTTYGGVSVPVASANTRAATTDTIGTDIPAATTIWLGHAGAAAAGAGLVTLTFEVWDA